MVKCKKYKIKSLYDNILPYPQIGVANGVAFCCSRTGKMQPSLRYILEAINHTVYNDTSKIEDPDLSHLSQQGVLLINSALTCEVDKPDSHTDIWKPFTAYLLDMISNKKQGLIFLFLGKQAQKNADLIDEYKHEILFASHPASAAYSKSKMWDCSDCFNKINELLKTKIKWKKDQN